MKRGSREETRERQTDPNIHNNVHDSRETMAVKQWQCPCVSPRKITADREAETETEERGEETRGKTGSREERREEMNRGTLAFTTTFTTAIKQWQWVNSRQRQTDRQRERERERQRERLGEKIDRCQKTKTHSERWRFHCFAANC